jgi:hypothetical protein
MHSRNTARTRCSNVFTPFSFMPSAAATRTAPEPVAVEALDRFARPPVEPGHARAQRREPALAVVVRAIARPPLLRRSRELPFAPALVAPPPQVQMPRRLPQERRHRGLPAIVLQAPQRHEERVLHDLLREVGRAAEGTHVPPQPDLVPLHEGCEIDRGRSHARGVGFRGNLGHVGFIPRPGPGYSAGREISVGRPARATQQLPATPVRSGSGPRQQLAARPAERAPAAR